jgi:hypothetical protein
LSSTKHKKRSFILELKKEGRINESFLDTVSDMTLEELISVKLELSARSINGKLYNFPLWYSITNICKDACIRFAISSCNTKTDMADVLGLKYNHFKEIYKKYTKE